MSKNNTPQNSHYREIKPASLDIAAPDVAPEAPGSDDAPLATSRRRSGLGLLAVAGLIALLVFVVFGLPKLISEPIVPSTATSGEAAATNGTQQPSATPQRSPFQEALDIRERRQAQDILEPLLDLKQSLQEQGVEKWAAEEFATALATANAGDELYRSGQYNKAIEQYSAALQALEQVQASKQAILDEALLNAGQALEAGQAAQAQTYFEQVLAIDAQNAAAQLGLQRVAVLDQTLEQLSAAQEFEAAGEYEQALASYQAANKLDAANAAASAGIKRVLALQSEAAFTAHMSAGYQALGEGRQSAAIAAFKKAQSLRPDSSEVREALAQASGEQTVSAISSQFRRARSLEQEERWADAAERYAAILNIDSTLQEAQQQRSAALQRQKLDDAFEKLIAEPLKLSRDTTYQSAQKVYAAGQNVANPGPRLRSQMGQLKAHMQNSRQEHPVQITSDGFTAVVVQRVAKLGTLSSRSLNLRPGEYVAVGSREGFRDVRKTFTVLPGQKLSVDIRCNEAI